MYQNYNPGSTASADNTRKFLNMSGGVLALAMVAVILLCCVGPVAFCLISGVIGAALPTPTPTP